MPADERWFTTTFNVSVEVANEDEAKALFQRAHDAIGDVLGEDRAWSVFGGKPVEDTPDA